MWVSTGCSCMQDGHQRCHVATAGKRQNRTFIKEGMAAFLIYNKWTLCCCCYSKCGVPQLQKLSFVHSVQNQININYRKSNIVYVKLVFNYFPMDII